MQTYKVRKCVFSGFKMLVLIMDSCEQRRCFLKPWKLRRLQNTRIVHKSMFIYIHTLFLMFVYHYYFRNLIITNIWTIEMYCHNMFVIRKFTTEKCSGKGAHIVWNFISLQKKINELANLTYSISFVQLFEKDDHE